MICWRWKSRLEFNSHSTGTADKVDQAALTFRLERFLLERTSFEAFCFASGHSGAGVTRWDGMAGL
jgi:hypothetical protein